MVVAVVLPIASVPDDLTSRVELAPRRRLPATSRVARGVVVPIPTFPVPLGFINTCPVVLLVAEFPIVNVCLLVVPIFPRPFIYVALSPLLADILAVGVPPAMFNTANLAEAVACPPMRKSRVELRGTMALDMFVFLDRP